MSDLKKLIAGCLAVIFLTVATNLFAGAAGPPDIIRQISDLRKSSMESPKTDQIPSSNSTDDKQQSSNQNNNLQQDENIVANIFNEDATYDNLEFHEYEDDIKIALFDQALLDS